MVFGFGKKKKKQDFTEELPPMGDEELGLPEFKRESEEQAPIGTSPGAGMPGFEQPSGFSQQKQMPQQYSSQEKEYEVLSAKLDALKAILDSINQRLENLERIARGDHERYY